MRKYITMILLSACIFVLAACDSHHTQPMNQMQRLHMLVDQALITAAHGANLKLEGSAQGQALLSDAGALLRRALSGPEMAMMHKGSKAMPAGMKQTHDLGDAAFDLLGLMMALSPDRENASQLRQLNAQLGIAASGSSLLLQAQSAGELKAAMQEHAHKLLDQASESFPNIQGTGAYHKLIGQLLLALGAHAQHTPDKH